MPWSAPAPDPTPDHSDAPTWPRVYRLGPGMSVFLHVAGALLAAGGLVIGAWNLWAPSPASPPWLPVAFGLAMLALGGTAILAVRRERWTLREDAIEFRELGRTRRFRREEIAGRRIVPLQYGQRMLVLELRGGRKPFQIGMGVRTDAALDAWLAALPDLDALERARAEQELLRSLELGASEAERREVLDRARRWSRLLSVLAGAAAVWGFLRPRPYAAAIAVLALIPAATWALVLARRGVYSLTGERNDPRPQVVLPLLVPGCVLMLRALLDLGVLDVERPLLWTVIACVPVGALFAASDPGIKHRALVIPLLTLLCGGSWIWGTLVFANALLDRSPSVSYPATVLGKQVTSGKHTTYTLRLSPWGPRAQAEGVDVPRALYDTVRVGDRVCPRLRAGALGFRWFVVGPCPGPR